MAKPTAQAAATWGCGINRAQATPMMAEIPCPAMTGHGCESGPCGTAKSNTALAPIEAMMTNAPEPGTAQAVNPTKIQMDNPPPSAAIHLSLTLTSISSTPSHCRKLKNHMTDPSPPGPVPTTH